MTNKKNHILVLNVCPGSITAKNIARTIVNDKLAACVNILPGVQSFFNWGGKVDTANEYMLFIKTTVDNYTAMEARLRKLHPYELPEIIAIPIQAGFDKYLDWIDTNTQS